MTAAVVRGAERPTPEPSPPLELPIPERVPPTVADGVERPLDPRHVPCQRASNWILSAVVGGTLVGSGLIVTGIMAFAAPDRLVWPVLATLAALGFSGGLAWLLHRWPERAHRHASYRVTTRGIEFRHGVYWRSVTGVPRSRIQHTDVSQGPIERRYGLAKLHLFTAGTLNSEVVIPGLAEHDARALADYLLAGEEGDEV